MIVAGRRACLDQAPCGPRFFSNTRTGERSAVTVQLAIILAVTFAVAILAATGLAVGIYDRAIDECKTFGIYAKERGHFLAHMSCGGHDDLP